MPKKRKKRPVKKKTKRKEEPLNWVVTGIVMILVAILAFVRLGFIGRQLTNLIRLFVGDSYKIGLILLIVFGLVMLIYGQPAHFGIKRNIGLILTYLGILLILSSAFFQKMLVHTNFVNTFTNAIFEEFDRANMTESVGGGLIGTIAYALLYPLLSDIGVRWLSFIFIVIGILMFFDVKFRTVVHLFQKFSQNFIQKSHVQASKLKVKYVEIHQEHKQVRQEAVSNRDKLKDPLEEDAPFYLDENKKEEKDDELKNEKEDEYISEPQIQIASQPKEDEVSVTHSLEADDLPKPVNIAEEDQKILREATTSGKSESEKEAKTNLHYKTPPMSLLNSPHGVDQSSDERAIKQNTQILEKTFNSFGVKVNIKKAILGPTITRYEVQPAVGVKVSKIVNLTDDLALALAAKDIRIEAPIPGKPYVGIEVPNKSTATVFFKDVMLNQTPKDKKKPLVVPLGKDVAGSVISADLTKMPHLLIAGSTGSGKSVAINTILTSILMKAKPEDVKLVLIDPKMVELSVYKDVPHLLVPVITDSKLAPKYLHKVVVEMEKRYKLFARNGVRNMAEYNKKALENNQNKDNPVMDHLPYILVVVDELSDLMMVSGHDVENEIVRLGQMARAAGIHMILATQRPSVDVITGLIKANVPSRISFAVSSGIDSRTILDQVGAEKLLGRGDMLYMPIGASKPERIQGAYIDVNEVERVVDFVKKQQDPDYDDEMIPNQGEESSLEDNDEDEYYKQAVEFVREKQSASVSMLQRRFRIGYNRAARIVEEMENRGIVGPSEGSKPRKVLISPKEHEE